MDTIESILTKLLKNYRTMPEGTTPSNNMWNNFDDSCEVTSKISGVLEREETLQKKKDYDVYLMKMVLGCNAK